MSRNMHHLITILLLLMPAQSATTGALRGTVLDPAGAVVPGATVTLVNPATGQTQTTMTDTKGLYGFSLLSPGAYDVSSLSTPINALFAAGGVTEQGSLRRIEHYR